ncbi:MAG: putative SAM-dependent methyltransferase [Deltaproteobacteria bacterium]|nr:putative SAM-dependent methyltransferase [Deltaproteobacteria bacterium]
MAQPWETLDRVNTADGVLELRRRGEQDFLIVINGRVLMNSSANRSEIALGESPCLGVVGRKRPRVLIGGLGMGLTLRAALDSLPPTAEVVVAEINPIVVKWCRGPLAGLTGCAVDDLRVTVVIDDVSSVIAKAAKAGAERFDAIVIDLYEGPHSSTDAKNDPFYGSQALKVTVSALSQGGVFAVWGENSDAAFEKRLTAAGFSVDRQRPGRGGLRHVVYLARVRK